VSILLLGLYGKPV